MNCMRLQAPLRKLLVFIHSEMCVTLQRLAVGDGPLLERRTSEAAFLERKVMLLTSGGL